MSLRSSRSGTSEAGAIVGRLRRRRDYWWQRHAIRRAATADARRRMPLPSLEGTVSTPFREVLWTRRDQQIVAVHAELIELVTHAEMRAAAAARAIELLERELATGRRAVAAARGRTVELTQRRLGDEGAPDDLVAARRRREHARAIRQLEKRCDRLSEAIAEQQRIEAAELAPITEVRRTKAAEAMAIHLGALVRCGVYDRTLLLRHPERQLVAYCLDVAPRPLPAWVRAYADDPEPATSDVDHALARMERENSA